MALALYGVGDLATTAIGLQHGSISEAGPVASVVFAQAGVLGLFLLKGAFFAGCAVVWSVLDTPGRTGIPLALAVVGVAVTGWNLSVLLA